MNDTNKISDIIRSSLEQINTMVGANTVIGDPINTPNGTTIIPVSKLFVGFASGGVDYTGKNTGEAAKPAANNFGGGGGTGLTVSPVAFLVVAPDGTVDMLNVNQPVPTDAVSQIISLIERSPELIEKVKNLIPKKNEEKAQ